MPCTTSSPYVAYIIPYIVSFFNILRFYPFLIYGLFINDTRTCIRKNHLLLRLYFAKRQVYFIKIKKQPRLNFKPEL